MAPSGFRRTGLEWFSSLPACLLLLAVVLFSTSSDIHNQMLRGGEQLWSGYYKLRMDPAKPECDASRDIRSEEHTSELQSRPHLVCRLLLEKKKNNEMRPNNQYY